MSYCCTQNPGYELCRVTSGSAAAPGAVACSPTCTQTGVPQHLLCRCASHSRAATLRGLHQPCRSMSRVAAPDSRRTAAALSPRLRQSSCGALPSTSSTSRRFHLHRQIAAAIGISHASEHRQDNLPHPPRDGAWRRRARRHRHLSPGERSPALHSARQTGTAHGARLNYAPDSHHRRRNAANGAAGLLSRRQLRCAPADAAATLQAVPSVVAPHLPPPKMPDHCWNAPSAWNRSTVLIHANCNISHRQMLRLLRCSFACKPPVNIAS